MLATQSIGEAVYDFRPTPKLPPSHCRPLRFRLSLEPFRHRHKPRPILRNLLAFARSAARPILTSHGMSLALSTTMLRLNLRTRTCISAVVSHTRQVGGYAAVLNTLVARLAVVHPVQGMADHLSRQIAQVLRMCVPPLHSGSRPWAPPPQIPSRHGEVVAGVDPRGGRGDDVVIALREVVSTTHQVVRSPKIADMSACSNPRLWAAP